MTQPSRHRRASDGDHERLLDGMPDTWTPEFAAKARRQSRIAANSSHAEEDQAFVDSISDWAE